LAHHGLDVEAVRHLGLGQIPEAHGRLSVILIVMGLAHSSPSLIHPRALRRRNPELRLVPYGRCLIQGFLNPAGGKRGAQDFRFPVYHREQSEEALMVRRSIWLGSFLLLSLLSFAQEALPGPVVSYAVDVTDPESWKIRVVMIVWNNVDDEVRLSIPAWAPGDYRIVKYSKQVWNLEAAGKGDAKLEVSPVDEQTWSVKTGRVSRFSVRYELTIDKLRMDKDHCFIAGPDT